MAKIPRVRIEKFLKRHATKERILDVGGGSGPYKKYFPNRVGFDVEPGPGVEYVGDAHKLSLFKDGEFSHVLSTEVLEHLQDPQLAINEMHRVLKDGGKLILTTRFVFPIHNAPGDYFRFTKYGLEHLLRNFRHVEIKEEIGTVGTLAVIFERLSFQADTMFVKTLGVSWLLLSKITLLFQWILTRQYSDVTRKSEIGNIMTSGYYVVAIK